MHIIAATFFFGFNCAIAFIVAATIAEPDISNFIETIDLEGFNEYPPESKVIPLPIITVFSLESLSPLYSITTTLGS